MIQALDDHGFQVIMNFVKSLVSEDDHKGEE